MQNIHHTISTTVFAVHPEFVTFLPHKYLSWVTFSTALSLAFLKMFLPPEKRTNDTWKWTLEKADSLLKTINLFPVQPLVFTPRNTNQWHVQKTGMNVFLDLSPISKMVIFHCQVFWDGAYPENFKHTQNGHTWSWNSPLSFGFRLYSWKNSFGCNPLKISRLCHLAHFSIRVHRRGS